MLVGMSNQISFSRRFKVASFIVIGILIVILSGCGAPKATETVDGFLSSFQSGDFEKASTFVEGGLESIESTPGNEEFGDEMLNIIAEKFKFKKPVEISADEKKAEVEVEITSIDVGVAMTATISEVMPMAFASAFSEQTEESEKAMEELMEKTAKKHLSDENAAMTTQTVKLNLTLDKEGNYKIIPDENLEKVILPNLDSVENIFGGSEESDETETAQSDKTVEEILVIAENQNYDVNPIKVTVEEVVLKKASNVPEDEQSSISYWAEKEVGDTFNYFYIKYNAENTSEEDYSFSGVNKVVLFAEGKQEVLDGSLDFIDYDEDQNGEYYGKVTKEGEVGFVFDTDPDKIEKIRLVIGHSMNSDTYDGGTDDQTVEFEIKK